MQLSLRAIISQGRPEVLHCSVCVDQVSDVRMLGSTSEPFYPRLFPLHGARGGI